MQADAFEAEQRAGEVYHSTRFPPQCWVVIRVDGRSFTRLTNERFDRPFDPAFHDCMCAAAAALLEDFGGVFATAHSDEISLLLPRAWGMFDRELEKAISVAAGIASARFSLASRVVGAFDGRAWVGATDQQVVDYYRWRQADAVRGALNSIAYWLLRRDGLNERQASARLLHQGASVKNELLHEHGVNFNEVPPWQRRGSLVRWESYAKEGHNPKTGEAVTVQRRRVVVAADPPMGEAYDDLIEDLILDRAQGAGS